MANYFIVENNKQAGPFSLEQLAAKGITPETNVWTDGMANWTPASQVSELQFLFAPQTPPIPQAQAPEPEPAPTYEQPLYEQPSYNSYQSQPEDTNAGSSEYNPMPKDYKTQSIIILVASFLCCPGIINTVLGILALLENNKIEEMYRLGNYAAAQAASDKAGKYCKIGFILMAVGIVLEIILLIVYVILIVANS